jgi:hypothetical protein
LVGTGLAVGGAWIVDRGAAIDCGLLGGHRHGVGGEQHNGGKTRRQGSVPLALRRCPRA